MHDRTRIDLAYLSAAIPWGHDAALVGPAMLGLVECTRAVDFMNGRDLYDKKYIQDRRAKQRCPVPAEER